MEQVARRASNWPRLRRAVVPIAALIGAGLVLALFEHLSAGLDYRAMVLTLRHLPMGALLAALGATGISFLALIGRDHVALRGLNARVPLPALIIAGFCGSALGNAVGFGALTGGAVRLRVYGALGVPPAMIARIMLSITLGFGVTLGLFGGASAAVAAVPLGHLLGLAPWDLRLGGGALFLILGGLILAAVLRRRPIGLGRFTVDPPGPGAMAAQFAVNTLDLLAAAAALWVLLPAGRVDFLGFAPIFSVATALGVISHLPGGIGVFEAVVVYALGPHVAPSAVAAALLAYRAIYFILPLLLSAALLALFELRRAVVSPAGERVRHSVGLLAPPILSAITFGIGIMLMVSGATPAFGKRLAVVGHILPLWAIETSHFTSSLAGVFLLFVARGLYHRLDGAWWVAVLVAAGNLGLGLAKGLAYGESVAIAFLLLALLATRRQFTRPASFIRQPFTPEWSVAIAVVVAGACWIMLFAFRDVAYSHDLWWQFELDAQAPRALRAAVGTGLLALGLALWQLLGQAAGKVAPPSADELERAVRIIRAQERSEAMLALMGDKSFLFAASGRAVLMYAKRGRSWVALFDPIGPREEWSDLVWRFVEMADAHGGRAAFYQVRAESLPVYLDAGLKIIKLGEEACIRLDQFTLAGAKRSGLRYALKRGERDGLSFEILAPDAAERQFEVLLRISDAWLLSHKAREKGFSVASFQRGFITAQSVALLRQHGEPVAFLTFMTTDLRREATVGIMRHMPDAPAVAMEFLFTRLALHLKEAGYAEFSLGVAPLSGIQSAPLSSRWHRIANLLFEHGGRVYNFQGLRMFKGKFQPDWRPRYMAASGTIGPFVSLADVAMLTGAGS